MGTLTNSELFMKGIFCLIHGIVSLLDAMSCDQEIASYCLHYRMIFGNLTLP